jgi:fructokinase
MAAEPASGHALTVGVDLGGTKIEAVVLRGAAGASAEAGEAHEPAVLARVRVPTEQEAGYDHIVTATAKIVRDVAREAGLSALPRVGVGMPGSVTFRRADGSRAAEALVKNSNTTCLNGRPFRGDLARALGTDAIAFANDANCFALAEAEYGAARGARVAFGVILGTGVGGGVVLRDASGAGAYAWDGLQGIAGEWGHVVLDPNAPLPCYCGRRGCVERYLSGPAIEEAYASRAGTKRSLADIATRRAHDADASAVLAEVVANFGRAIATVINILDPDVVVLGGGVSNLALFYEEGPAAVAASVAQWAFTSDLQTPIVKNTLGDSAGVIGAALLR